MAKTMLPSQALLTLRTPVLLLVFLLSVAETPAAEGLSRNSPVFPAPADCHPGPGGFDFDGPTTVHYGPDSRYNAEILYSALLSAGIPTRLVADTTRKDSRHILIFSTGTTAPPLATGVDAPQQADAFLLSIKENRLSLKGSDNGGELYGVLALLQMVDRNSKSIPAMEISDGPAMAFRGLRGHFPKNDRKEIERFKAIVRAMAYCRLNQLWIRDLYVRRFPGSLQWASHPEIVDPDAISKTLAGELIDYAARYNVKVMGSISSTSVTVQSIYPELIELFPDERPETVPIENETNPTAKYRPGSRFNLCPSQEATYDLLFDLIDEIADLFTSEVIDLGIDEVSQTENGSRWAADAHCAGKDPVQLFADYTNRLADHVIEKGKTPLVNSTPFIKQHGGDYLDIYRSVDRIRKEILVNNWSEKIARQHSWFLKLTGFSSTDYFRRHGLPPIIHMTGASRRWRDRPDLLETRGKAEIHGAFITHYTYMTGHSGVRPETIDDMAFSGQHFWSPDIPSIGSDEDTASGRKAKAVISALLTGASFGAVIPQPLN
jgi:hypothetical protein